LKNDITYRGYTQPEITILRWLHENVNKSRLPKQKHLYIYGPPDTGKSSLLNFLSQRLRLYDLPHEAFFDFYDDDSYDLIAGDEFHSNFMPRTILCPLIDGYETNLRVKGAQIMKKKNIPAIFCSNYPLTELYKGVDLTAMLSRFEVLDLTDHPLAFHSDFEFDDDATLPYFLHRDDAIDVSQFLDLDSSQIPSVLDSDSDNDN